MELRPVQDAAAGWVGVREVAAAMRCHPATARRRMRAAGGRLDGRGRLVVEARYLEAYAAQRVAQSLAAWGFDAGRVAALLAHASPVDGPAPPVAELDPWVTTDQARALLRLRRAEALRRLAGLEHRGSGRRGDPWRYRRSEVLALVAG